MGAKNPVSLHLCSMKSLELSAVVFSALSLEGRDDFSNAGDYIGETNKVLTLRILFNGKFGDALSWGGGDDLALFFLGFCS